MADCRVIERRLQMIETQQTTVARGVSDLNLDI